MTESTDYTHVKWRLIGSKKPGKKKRQDCTRVTTPVLRSTAWESGSDVKNRKDSGFTLLSFSILKCRF